MSANGATDSSRTATRRSYLFVHPHHPRHPERSAAKSKDPEGINTTKTAQTFSTTNPQTPTQPTHHRPTSSLVAIHHHYYWSLRTTSRVAMSAAIFLFTPHHSRHPERSAAKSKDPEGINTTKTAQTFQPRRSDRRAWNGFNRPQNLSVNKPHLPHCVPLVTHRKSSAAHP